MEFLEKMCSVLRSRIGCEVIRGIVEEFPDLEIYLAGGIVRDVVLDRQSQIKDIDLFVNGKSVESALRLLDDSGHLTQSPHGTPRWYPRQDIEEYFDFIPIRQFYNGGIGESAPMMLSIFEGFVDGIETTIASGEETIEIIARDISARLNRTAVFGVRAINPDGSTKFAECMPLVFNKGGIADASREQVSNAGKVCKVFEFNQSFSRYWSYAEIIVYLLNEYLPYGLLQIPVPERLEVLTGFRVAGELDVEGLSLLGALEKCCS